MLIHTAHLTCRPEASGFLRDRLRRHAAQSLQEPGCRSFDIYQSSDREDLFLLFEIYDGENALTAHRASSHFASFRRDVDDFITARAWWFWQEDVSGN